MNRKKQPPTIGMSIGAHEITFKDRSDLLNPDEFIVYRDGGTGRIVIRFSQRSKDTDEPKLTHFGLNAGQARVLSTWLKELADPDYRRKR